MAPSALGKGPTTSPPCGWTAPACTLGMLPSAACALRGPGAPAAHTPTVRETGPELAKFDVSSWFGIFLPKSAPAPIVDALNKEIKVFLEREDTKRNIAAMGARTDYGTPQQFSDFVQAETAKFATIIKQEGLQMDVN